MSYAIVYSTRTGNTRLLAETVRAALPREDCLYFGLPDDRALEADRIYLGFWTDRSACDADSAAFLPRLDRQELFLFGSAGAAMPEYLDKVLSRARDLVKPSVPLVGTFMCQGRMPQAVRKKYETRLQQNPGDREKLLQRIDNFDRALSHPDQTDLDNLTAAVRAL